ncbi:MAG TPA: ASKHA domain-containing protein [Desulfitobacteriaceae bacterium]|nr:ASKHA domain-containing protein [Desulfitobacteriaceae bacterium]
MNYKVLFQPSGLLAAAEEGMTLMEAARQNGISLNAPCNGGHSCGKCRVKVREGITEQYDAGPDIAHLSPMTPEEKLLLDSDEQNGQIRLACFARVSGNITVRVLDQNADEENIILESGKEKQFEIKPAVKKYFLRLKKSTLEDNRDDFSRLCDFLKEAHPELKGEINIDYQVLKTLPDILRKSSWRIAVTVLYGQEIIAVEPVTEDGLYGMAVDLGTTTIAAYLCDLNAGRVLLSDSMLNPQISYGDDVLSRISYCLMNEDGLAELNRLIIDTLNGLFQRMAEAAGIAVENITETVLVFNTAMHHIALNINPGYLGVSPFPSAISCAVDLKARDCGLRIAPAGNVHCLPVEAGFVGADNVAVLIAEEPYKQEKMRLIIDIGTNGEICLGNKERLLSTSCATGPAFEGAQIKCGMRAAKGAIEGVFIEPGTLEAKLKVIGRTGWRQEFSRNFVQGICGSGIIDAVAQMLKAGIIDSGGKIQSCPASARIRKGSDGKMEYVLLFQDQGADKDIVINQKDIRAVQLAKAALYAGARILMKRMGVEKPDGITLAGAFGNYINKHSALAIGMFPDCGAESIVSVGNSAGIGAKMALLSVEKRREAQETAEFIEFVETASEPDFPRCFADAMYFPR